MKSGWATVSFAEAVEDVTGGHIKTKQADYLPAGRFPIVDQGRELVGGFTDDPSALSPVELPAILFGDHTRCVKYVDFPFGAGADGVKVLRPRSGVDARYLYYVIRSTPIPSAGYSRHFKFLKEVEIPLPPVDEQRRIASVLDAADGLRVKRRQALAKLDTLSQAIFLDMFGDPLANNKGYPRQRLGSLAVKFSDGPFGSNLKSNHYVTTGVRVIRLQNIGVGRFVDDDVAYVTEAHFETLRKHECLPGDVLVGTLGDPNLRACIQPAWLPLALNKADCVQVRVDPATATNRWMSALLNCPATVAMAHSLVKGQTRSRISMGRLRELEVPVPPLLLQQEFGARLDRVEAQASVMQGSLRELSALFASLRQLAFRGEL